MARCRGQAHRPGRRAAGEHGTLRRPSLKHLPPAAQSPRPTRPPHHPPPVPSLHAPADHKGNRLPQARAHPDKQRAVQQAKHGARGHGHDHGWQHEHNADCVQGLREERSQGVWDRRGGASMQQRQPWLQPSVPVPHASPHQPPPAQPKSRTRNSTAPSRLFSCTHISRPSIFCASKLSDASTMLATSAAAGVGRTRRRRAPGSVGDRGGSTHKHSCQRTASSRASRCATRFNARRTNKEREACHGAVGGQPGGGDAVAQ